MFELTGALRFLSLLLNELSYRALLGLKMKLFSSANKKLFHFASLIKRTGLFTCMKQSVAFFLSRVVVETHSIPSCKSQL